MNFNRKVLSMALGGAALPLGLAAANDSLPLPKPISNVGRLSDSGQSFGNSAVTPQRPLMNVEPRHDANGELKSTGSSRSGVNSYQPAFRSAGYTVATQQASSDFPMMESPSGTGCSTGCASSSCSSGSCASGSCDSNSCDGFGCGKKLGCGLSNMLGWGEVEALLWWGPNVQSPPLAASGPLGQPTNHILAGGDQAPLGGQMQTGLRANIGVWLDDCQTIGVGGRAFGLFTDSTSQTYSSNGSTTLGVPYFSVIQGAPVDYQVAFNTQGNGVDTGSITVDNKTSLLAAEGYGRFLLAKSAASRADMIGGYTFARLDDTLGLHTRSVDGITNSTIDGTVSETFDRFSTKNTFHGGHIGFTTDMTQGRWTFSTLGKVALGNMNQRASITGRFVDTPPTGTPATGNIGLLAQNSNIGSMDRNVFTFLPEAGAKLRYGLTSKLKFNVGYTFLFFPDVALAGNMIDPTIDFSNVNAPTAPRAHFGHSSYYLHGIDLGLTYQY